MASRNLAHSNEARTCGVATVRSGRPSAKPSDARSSSAAADTPQPPTSAEPGSQGRPDRAGEARERAPRDPAEGRERARMVVSPTKVADSETPTGGEVSPPAKSQQPAHVEQPREPASHSSSNTTQRDVAFGKGVCIVGQRVDMLVVAFRLGLGWDVVHNVRQRQELANQVGSAEVTLEDFRFALKRRRSLGGVPFENADLRGIFDEGAAGGFVLELTLRATCLATRSLEEALSLVFRVANAFGVVHEARLRRFDLAADYAGFDLRPADADRVQTTRARLASFRVDDKDVDGLGTPEALREHRNASHQVTGITIAAGNPFMARVYAKGIELQQPGREQKRAIEHAIWSANGWDGTAPVTRVEFQGRGVFLDEINLRDPRALPEKLDPVFQRGVRWVRLIDLNSSTRRTRCALDARWQVVTDTVFSHAAAPIERSRAFRGGARPSHVSGSVQSALASTGLLRPPQLVTADGRTFEDPAEFAGHLDPGAAVEWVHNAYRDMFRSASDLCADDAVARFGPHAAVVAVATKNEAARARFWSHDDLKGLKK